MLSLTASLIPGLESLAGMALLAGLLIAASHIVLQLVIAACGYCYSIFRSMIGKQYVLSTDGSIGMQDFAYKLIQNSAIQKLFFTLLIVAIILLVLSTIIKTITSEFNFQKDGNAKSKILIDAVKALALFVVVPIVSILGLMLANFLLGVIIVALESAVGVAEWYDFTNMLEGIVGNVGWGSALNAVLSIFGVMNFIMIGCMWPVAKKLLGATIGMFQRMFEIALLWAISAPIIALMPITEGPYKSWVKEYSSRVLGLFGVVVSVNVVVFVIKIGNQFVDGLKLGSFEEFLAELSVLYAGMAMIDTLASSIASMIGGKEYGAEGSKLGSQMMGAVTSGFKSVGAGVMAAKLAKGAIDHDKALRQAKKADLEDRLKADKDKNGKTRSENLQHGVDKTQDMYDKAKQEREDFEKAHKGQKLSADDEKELNKLKTREANAKKNLDNAKSRQKAYQRDMKKRIGASDRQLSKFGDLQAKGRELANEEVGSEAYNAKLKEMEGIKKELGDMGINSSAINNAFDKLKAGDVAGGLAGLNGELNTMRTRGVKVKAGMQSNQLGELMARRSAQSGALNEAAAEAKKAYTPLQEAEAAARADYNTAEFENGMAENDLDLATQQLNDYAAENSGKNYKRHVRYQSLVKKQEEASAAAHESRMKLDAAKGVLDNAHAAAEPARQAYLQAQANVQRNDKFIKQTEKAMQNPHARKGAVVAGLGLAAGWLFGSEKNLGETWSAVKSNWHEFSAGTTADITAEGIKFETAQLQKQYATALEANQGMLDLSGYVKKMGLPAGAKPSDADRERITTHIASLDQQQVDAVQRLKAEYEKALRDVESAAVTPLQTALTLKIGQLGSSNAAQRAQLQAEIEQLKVQIQDAKDNASRNSQAVTKNVAMQLQEAINTAVTKNNTKFSIEKAIEQAASRVVSQSSDSITEAQAIAQLTAAIGQSADAIKSAMKEYKGATDASSALEKYDEAIKAKIQKPKAPETK